MACPFLGKAPLEIRNEIYSYLLSAKYTKRLARDDEKRSRAERGLRGSFLYDFQPAILCTNKRINCEARRLLYDENLFVLVTYPFGFPSLPFRTEQLTLLAVREHEVNCFLSSSRISLRVDLKHHGVARGDFSPMYKFVMAAHELGALCSGLENFQQELPGFLMGLNVKLGVFPRSQLVANAPAITGSFSPMVWSSRPLPEQRMLLEPFGRLHSVKNLEIACTDGKTERIDAQLMKEVKERAGRPPPSMEEVAITATKIEGHGNEAFHAGDFLRACVLYKSAWENLKPWNYNCCKAELPKLAAHKQLGFRIRSSFIAALLRLLQQSQAHELAIEDLKEIACTQDLVGNAWYDPGESAKLCYLKALVCEGMGETTQAVEEIRQAFRFDPNNMAIMSISENGGKSGN